MRRRKLTAANSKRGPVNTIWLLCSKCGRNEEEVEDDASAVVCHICCAHMGPQVMIKQPTEPEGPQRPKGWHLMKQYVDPEGNVFEMGEAKPELKGTLPMTPIKVKKTKAQRELDKMQRESHLAQKHEKKLLAKKAHDQKKIRHLEDRVSIGEEEPIS
jgi:hypothetical protein